MPNAAEHGESALSRGGGGTAILLHMQRVSIIPTEGVEESGLLIREMYKFLDVDEDSLV